MVFNIMKRPGVYIIVGLLVFAAFPKTGWAVQNRISPSTVPPSSRHEGLIRSPNPIDRSGNLLVTGNIRGGRYFRGIVPYRAPTYFGAETPSSSLDSFVRDSAGSEDFSRFSAGYKPYYSPTETVTTTIPGYSGVIGPSTMDVGARPAQPTIIGNLLPRRDTMFDPRDELSLRQLRPMSMTPEEMEKLISSELATYSHARRLTDQQYQPQIEQFSRDVNQVSDKTAELMKTLTARDDSLSAAAKPSRDVLQRVETPTQKEQVPKGQASEENVETPFGATWAPDLDKQLDVHDQMKRQLAKSQKELELAMATQQTEKAAEEEDKKPAGEQTQEDSQAKKLAEIVLSVAKAKGILGPYETFASFSEDKFNQHMRAGEQYLKQGKYYRAADAYTLASIYKPDDPLAYAGKSHALFAAGEYMSSALFLSRALQIFPEYAQFKIDIEAMVGNRDKLESRIVDVEDWLKRSGAPELQFLLAYVYYQMDRPERAKEAIDAACEKMPQAPAVIALKKAIEMADSK